MNLEDAFWVTLLSTIGLLVEVLRRHRRDSMRPRPMDLPPPRPTLGSRPSDVARFRTLRNAASLWQQHTVSNDSPFDEGFGAGVHYCGEQLHALLDRLGVTDDDL